MAYEDPTLASRLRLTIHPGTVKRWLILADVVAGLVGIALAFLAEALWWPVELEVGFGQWLVVLASVPFWYASGIANQMYAARGTLVASTSSGTS